MIGMNDKLGNELEYELVRILKSRNMTVATAESCTAGLVASRIVNAPGASDVFREGFITYSNEAKSKYLHVDPDTLVQYGAVSAQTAAEMAEGAAAAAGSDCSISVTGIAGPDGGTPEKPVGLVYIGVSVQGTIHVEKCQFHGTRRAIREQSAEQALLLLKQMILG